MRLIAVTGLTSSRVHALAKQAGFDAVLTKPIVPEALEAVLKQCRD
jgi:CheY-like chemotaxis protein